MGGVSLCGELTTYSGDTVATFDLRVSMTGLGLFATQAPTKQLHFLMPSSDSADGHAGHEGHEGHAADHVHSACIVLNAAYLQPNSPAEIPNAVVAFSIGGQYLDLSALGTNQQTQDPASQLPPEVFDFGKASNSHIDPSFVGGAPGDRVASRVTISKGDLECYEPGARWHVLADAPGVNNIAYLLTWQISGVELDGDGSIRLQPVEFESGKLAPLPKLYPTTNNNRIHIWAMHLPPDQMPPFGPKPPPLNFGDEPPHLPMAYKLLGPDPRWPVIRYLDTVNNGKHCNPRWPSDRRETTTPPTAVHRHAIMPSGGAAFGDEWTCIGVRAEVK